MAQIIVEKSPIASFLDELPGLILQYKQMQVSEDRYNLGLEAEILDRQLTRAERKYDEVYGEVVAQKEDFQTLTGQLYKAPEKDTSGNAIPVAEDIQGGIVNSLNQILVETRQDTEDLRTAKGDINKQMREAKLLSDFYVGVGHDYSAGDPERWDIEDFSDEQLAEYMSQYPELEGTDQRAFYEGMKTRGAANLLQTTTSLNLALDQARTAQLSSNVKKLEYDTKVANVPVAQIEADIENINSGVHNMLGSQAQNLNSSLLAPSIQASVDWVGSQDDNTPEGDPELKDRRDTQLRIVGASITGTDPASADEYLASENLRLGKLLVLGNSNYINSVKGFLKGSEDLNYLGYVDALQEIQMYAENERRKLEAGLITTESYLAYKNNLEEIVGTNLNDFSSKMDIILQASNATENKGRDLAIKGMKDAFIEDTLSVDYEYPEDYESPMLPEFPDSSTVLPDSSSILSDSTAISTPSLNITPDTEAAIDSLSQIYTDPEDIFAEIPLGEKGKTWGELWEDWKDIGSNVTMAGVSVSASVLNTLSNITSREEMVTYLARLEEGEAEKLPRDMYQAWLELNKGK